MKAMIRRDLYLSRRILLGALIFVGILGYFNKEIPPLTLISLAGCFISIMYINMSFYNDETSHDIQYYLLVNHGQELYLKSKYFVSAFVALITALASLVYLALAQDLASGMSIFLAGLNFSFLLVISGFLLVFFIYFGSQLGRYLVFVLWIAILSFSRFFQPAMKSLIQRVLNNIPLSLLAILALSLLFMGLSYFLSMKRLNQKDF